MIKNDAGLVLIRHWNSNPSPYTQPQHSISLGWVKEEDLPKILEETAKVCCGAYRKKYRLGTQVDLNVFTLGHY